MACPHFFPVLPPAGEFAERRPRSPLGGECRGACHADSSAAFQPDDGTLQALCNFGYGRASCPRFPDHSPFDAVRFSVTQDEGGDLRIVFVLERDYSPLRHGIVRYRDGYLEGELPDECVERQALVFAGAYARRKART